MAMGIDLLYLGINMGNCLKNRRFFDRYPEAQKDYYEGFKWLVKLNKEHPELMICIKHHSGDYRPERDTEELDIIKYSNIIYIDNTLNSFIFAEESKMCVSYCSSMILELNGYPRLARFIYEARHHKYSIKHPCKRPFRPFINFTRPAYYLDPGHRNKQLCMYIDDVNKHNCNNCDSEDLEIFEPYRLCNYEQFKNKAKEIIKWI